MKPADEGQPTPVAPSRSSELRGIGLIAFLTLAVAAALVTERPESADSPQTETARAADTRSSLGSRLDPRVELSELVEVPAGPFAMGSDPRKDPRAFANERWSNVTPQGRVELPTFYVYRFETTVAQFRAFVEATGFAVHPEALSTAPDYPVGYVSWPDALAYCRWLDSALRESPKTPPRLRDLLREGWRVSLPSEAQWEKAARGADGRVFPWGDEPRSDRANYRSSGPAPVGSFECPECAFGLSDMSGNVWELTRSPYRAYPFEPSFDEIDLDADALWVMRGGSYGDPEQNIRAAIRGGADPGARRPFIGFRIVLTP